MSISLAVAFVDVNVYFTELALKRQSFGNAGCFLYSDDSANREVWEAGALLLRQVYSWV